MPSPLARRLQHEIAAHRKTDQCEARHALFHEVARNRSDVGREAGVVECGSKVIGPAAVALVHTNHVHAGGQALLRDSDHVARFAGTFQAVYNDHGQSLAAVFLPMTMAQDLYAGRDLDEPFLGFGQA